MLADVEGHVCIDLEGGDNKVHKVSGKKSKSVSNKEKVSRLDLLLTCKTINAETSAMAYSKMTMSLGKKFYLNTADNHEQRRHQLTSILDDVTKVFPRHLILQIPVMEFSRTRVLFAFIGHDLWTDVQRNSDCTAKCALHSWYQGQIHALFHKVKCIIVYGSEERMGGLYSDLTEGASWLSVTMQPQDVGRILNVFSNLEEIVVRLKRGEQVNKVIDGKVYAAESGMEMRGIVDWMRKKK